MSRTLQTFAPLLLVLLTACATGPAEETIIDELRIVAASTEPAEVAAGETFELDVWVGDPEGLGAEVLAWSCTPAGDTCLEAVGEPSSWMTAGEPVQHRFAGELSVSTALAPAPALPLWVLACEPGLCPIIGEARQAMAQGSVSEDLASDLADPLRWIADLPIRGTSLALRSVPLTVDGAGERNLNPRVEVSSDPSVPVEGGVDLDVNVIDDGEPAHVAFGLATGGGFGLPSLDILGGQGALTFYAPDEQGEVELFVVVDDGEGGTGVWHGSLVIEPGTLAT